MTRQEYRTALLKFKGESGSRWFNYFNMRGDWCAMFTSYANRELLNNKDFPKSTTVISGSNAIERYLKDHINTDFRTAEIGDIITFENNGNQSDGADHVGICIGNANGMIEVIEGNTAAKTGFLDSTVNVYRYAYDNRLLCHCIDMSWWFTDKTENVTKPATRAIKRIVIEYDDGTTEVR